MHFSNISYKTFGTGKVGGNNKDHACSMSPLAPLSYKDLHS